ncbi:hypothetical protein ACTXJX_14975 [Glutamicibacter ardleyensis]|uniref:hypothetical protein n=1 Tax=Glutamicibacter ardleyensis TaxID=225894 RepID=UPI003FD24564
MSSENVLEHVRFVCRAPVAEREQFIAQFMRSTVTMRAVAGIADRYLRSNRIDRTYFADLKQVILTGTWQYLIDLSDSSHELDELRNFWGMVYRRCANAVQQFVVHEVNHFGGVSAQIRTHKDFDRFVASQRANGVTAPDGELIAQFNQGRRSRSEQMTVEKARHGLPYVSSFNEPSHPGGAGSEPVSEDSLADDSFLLHPHEAQAVVAEIIEELKRTAKDPETAEYADIWLGGFYRDDGEVLPVTHIAEAMGITRHRARTLQSRVRAEAQSIIKEKLGITSA